MKFSFVTNEKKVEEKCEEFYNLRMLDSGLTNQRTKQDEENAKEFSLGDD